MENFNGSSNLRNLSCLSRQFLLPPRSTILCNFPPNAEHISGNSVEITQGFPTPNDEEQAVYHHQHTSSDSFLLEEQPSWFEELLNEPVEAPVTGNHRRSLSDPFTYLDATPNIATKEEVFMFKDISAGPPPKASNQNHELNYQDIMSYALFHTNPTSSNENEFCESSSTTSTFSIGLPISTITDLHTSEASSCSPNNSNSMAKDQEKPFMPNGSDCCNCSHANLPAQNKDSKRSKQYVVCYC